MSPIVAYFSFICLAAQRLRFIRNVLKLVFVLAKFITKCDLFSISFQSVIIAISDVIGWPLCRLLGLSLDQRSLINVAKSTIVAWISFGSHLNFVQWRKQSALFLQPKWSAQERWEMKYIFQCSHNVNCLRTSICNNYSSSRLLYYRFCVSYFFPITLLDYYDQS